ncbi:bifunctional diguanylate cyclase/phosphodiesterase [Stagnimonas aquatica]|uniref:Bifunctional diguanylate cyclase/phosphodiesterase n=1 Tax=Stagnimonas aquatica TaxID=2689987 RepID=A0A3N0V1I6_9GAMM|nr:bifunctional diguanylate cyclase/phosphodiesterase [Stagnimonas aquatica]ROH86657.1 bifunctional diguanylate cyclase/phosphodiesterase [Stagnimonas aquatica]
MTANDQSERGNGLAAPGQDAPGAGVGGVLFGPGAAGADAGSTESLVAERLSYLLQEAGLGLWEWNMADGRLAISPQCRQILELAPGEDHDDSAEHWRQRIHPDDFPTLSAAFSAAASLERPGFDAKFRVRSRAGDYRWMRTTVRALTRLASNAETKVIGTLRDVHAQEIESQQTRLSLEREQTVFRTLTTGLAMVSPEGQWLAANEALCRMLGYGEAELTTQSFQAITHPEDLAADLQLLQRTLAGELQGYQIEKRYVRRDGTILPAHLSTGLVRDAEGRPAHFISAITDLSEQKAAERYLRLQRDETKATLDTVRDCVVKTNCQGYIQVCNAAFLRLVGADAESMLQGSGIGHWLRLRVPEAEVAAETADADGEVFGQLLSLADSPSGKIFDVHSRGGAVSRMAVTVSRLPQLLEAQHDAYVIAFADLSEELRLRHAIEKVAATDLLIDMPNRIAVEQEIRRRHERICRGDSPEALVITFDIDEMRVLNDRLGHAAGDRVLRALADSLQALLPVGGYCGRWVSDQFVLICEPQSRQELAAFYARLHQRFQAHPSILALPLQPISFSAGVAVIDARPCEARSFVLEAEYAAREAKREGGNALRLYQEVRNAVDERRQAKNLRSELQGLISEGRILLYGQNIYDGQRQILGQEVLARIRNHEGVSSAGPLIEAAERAGYSSLVDRHVFEQLSGLLGQRNPARTETYSLNLSARAFDDAILTSQILRWLEEHPLHARRLQIEITETTAIADLEVAAMFIGRLRALGVMTLVDDFGCGFASFSHLKHLPVAGIKIDRSYVHDIHQDQVNRAIVKNISQTARDLGLVIVAEGVEQEPEFEVLAGLGVQRFQGWLLHRAEPLA